MSTTPDSERDSQPTAPRGGLLAAGAVLTVVLIALACVQWRQFQWLNSPAPLQSESLGWSVLSLALTALLGLLLIGLAALALRQLKALAGRRQQLEERAARLDAARLDAEAASRAKSAFLANMSHEIRTPLHGMLGMLSLLQESRLTPSQASHLETARDAAHHLLQVLNDILDLSQVESGHLQVVPQTIDLPQLIAQVDALMRVQALTKGLGLHVVVATEVPRWVRADATRVKQILFNLLNNAIKFSDAGTITLNVACGWIPAVAAAAVASTAVPGHAGPAQTCILFALSDPGIGMAPATVERLFQRLPPGDSISHQMAGVGLGLEISRDLARVMGGDITVRSVLGAGSTFTASLPLTAVGAPLASDAQASPAQATSRPLRVLVAEDHSVNRAYMEAVLDKLGHIAVFSADGGGAVFAVQEQPVGQEFDIVLMDLHMPGIDGFAAARAIRALAPPRGDVPIVALTADAFHASRERARESGMDGFLTKPAHLPQLREALQRYGSSRSTAVPVAASVPLAKSEVASGSASESASGSSSPASSRSTPALVSPLPLPSAVIARQDETLDRSIVGDMIQTLSAAQYARLLSIFFGAHNQTVTEMREAVARAALDLVRSQAHGLKGASLSLGLRALASLAEQIPPRQSDINFDTAALSHWIDALDHQFSVTHAECVRLGCLDA